MGYRTESASDRVIKSEFDRIADAVRDVDGVGQETLANIANHFDHYPAFESASRRKLELVDGVGPQTARRIVEQR